MRSTHTYAILEVSQSAFDEIKAKLVEADYGHAFSQDGKTIDMHGIALEAEEPKPTRVIIRLWQDGSMVTHEPATECSIKGPHLTSECQLVDK